MSRRILSVFRRGTRLCLGASLLLAASATPAFAVFINPGQPIPTQLLSFGPIQGNVFLPLTDAATSSTEAGAPAATADGYGWVNSNIAVTLSSQRQSNPGPVSVGEARLGVPSVIPTVADVVAAAAVAPGCVNGAGQAGNVNTGDTVCVNSFFDVFFDVTVTDVDITAGFFGGQGPQSVAVLDQGPTFLQQSSECIADTSQPNLGCLPPVGSAYIGHFQVVLALGDVNGNGNPDVIKFDFVAHDVGGVTNVIIQGTNVIDTFDSTITGGGSVQDALTDPPFSFTLTGPTTARQGIVFPAQVPEPGTLALMAAGIAFFGWQRRRKAA